MPINTIDISDDQVQKILQTTEGHFHDVKAVEIAPGKLTRTMAAFANAEGGELFIGIDEIKTTQEKAWRGFSNEEAANGHLYAFEALFPLGAEFDYTFLRNSHVPGLVLQAAIHKTVSIRTATDGIAYVRRGAMNYRLATDEEVARLRYNKGLTSFETELVPVESAVVENSATMISFMLEAIGRSGKLVAQA